MKSKIALVDDDHNILASLSMAMEAEGFNVVSHENGEVALDSFQSSVPDLIVSDVKMPRMDGMTLLKKLRGFSDVPFILLTSKDDEIDQLLGLRHGADDYITKPFSQRLLIERIRVLLRRTQSAKSVKAATTTLGDLILDDDAHTAKWKGAPLPLSVTEYLLIKTLTTNPGHVKSRDQLIDKAYGETVYVDDRTVDSHIKRLRKKFKKADDGFDRIETVYGAGYRYKCDDE